MSKYVLGCVGAVSRFLRNNKGASMVEYGILVALIAVVSIGVITSIGSTLNTKFSAVNTSLSS